MTATILRTLSAAGLTCLALNFTSCSSSIPIQMAIPATYDLGRGSSISISYGGSFADEATDKFIQLVKKDGYYTVTHPSSSNYNLQWISQYDTNGNPLARVTFVIRRGNVRGPVLKSTEVSANLLYMDQAGEVAKRCYHIITPHEKTLKIYPKAKTPELEKAVEMCKAGRWDSARQSIQEAMEAHPDDAENFYMMSILETKDMNYEASDAWLRKAYSIKPEKRYQQAIKNNAVMRTNDAAVARQLSRQH